MEPEMEHLLQSSSKKQLVLLVQELIVRHPDLQAEMATILGQLAETTRSNDATAQQSHAEWDDDNDGDLMDMFHSISPPVLPPLDLDAYRERIRAHLTRVKQKKAHQAINDDLLNLLKDAEKRANHEDYYNSLQLYALVVDERLAEHNSTFTSLLDKALGEVMPVLQSVLGEASSNIVFDSSAVLTPLLTPEMRRCWLERLFALWLKRLDAYHVEEDIPEILLDIAWNDDMAALRDHVQTELLRLRQSGHSNIVDFSRQYRTRALERFLKELPSS